MKRPAAALAAALIAVGAVAFWYARLVLPAWRLPYAPSLGNVDLFAQPMRSWWQIARPAVVQGPAPVRTGGGDR